MTRLDGQVLQADAVSPRPGSGPSSQQLVPTVDIRQASLAYRSTPVLSGVNGSVAPGEALALVGPNGSGKTTLLRALVGMVSVVEGSVTVCGAPAGRAPRGSIGYVPQTADLDPSFPVTALDVVLMGTYPALGLGRFPGRATRARCVEALESVGLAHVRRRRFGELSGGQRQRVLLARCIAAQPRLVLLDEPFNGLDQPNRQALLEVLRSMKSEGVAVIVSTHDLLLAEEVCEQVALLAGRQIAFGPREEVLVPHYIDQAFGTAAPSAAAGGLEAAAGARGEARAS